MNQTKKAEIKQRIPLYPSINSIYADMSEGYRAPYLYFLSNVAFQMWPFKCVLSIVAF